MNYIHKKIENNNVRLIIEETPKGEAVVKFWNKKTEKEENQIDVIENDFQSAFERGLELIGGSIEFSMKHHAEAPKNWHMLFNSIDEMPDYLGKIINDYFDAAVCLKNGQIFRFKSMEIVGKDFVLLNGMHELNNEIHGSKLSQFIPSSDCVGFARGALVRFGEIAWIADAPSGS